MDSFNNFFSLMVLLCGVYCLYQAIYLAATGKMPHNCILISKDMPLSSCLDPEEYISRMKPRFLIFSIVLVICAGISMVNGLTGFLTTLLAGAAPLVRLLVMEGINFILPFGVLIWFAVTLVRTQKQLW